MKKLRIFAAVTQFNWENNNLIEGLRSCGHEVIQYDWQLHGFSQYDSLWDKATTCNDDCDSIDSKKMQMNEEMFNLVKEENAKKHIDLFFGYLSDPNTFGYTIQKIKNLGIYTINYGCNNQLSFERANLNIAPLFDCTLHAEKYCGTKFKSIGANSLHMPLAINPDFYKNMISIDTVKSYDTGFIGQWYGYRLAIMATLPSYGFSCCLASKVTYGDMFKLIAHTKVNCGFRGLNNADFTDKHAKQIRLRDFEVTGCGGFYLTEELPELEDCYIIGKEIVTFGSREEFYDKIKYYTAHDTEREKIAKAGMERCRSEHIWEKRFNKVFKELNLI